MKSEARRTENNFGSDYRLLVQLPVNNRGVELIKEQALLTAGQEIADLYQMLRDKCKHKRVAHACLFFSFDNAITKVTAFPPASGNIPALPIGS